MFKSRIGRRSLNSSVCELFLVGMLGTLGILWFSDNSYAGQVIYSFVSAPNFSTTSIAPTYIPSDLTLGIQDDLDTLEIGLNFRNNITADQFLPQSVTGLQGTVTPILQISLTPVNSNTQVSGVFNGSINLSTTANVYSLDVPMPSKSWVSASRFGNEATGKSISPCVANSILKSTRKQTLTFLISRACTELSAQFSVQAQITFQSADGNLQYSAYSPQSPFMVDLSKVPGFKLPQTISAEPLPNVFIGQGSLVISAADSANLPMNYSAINSNGVCTVANTAISKVTLLAPGQCTISISSVADSSHSAAKPVQLTFKILAPQLEQTISSSIPSTISLDDPQVSFQISSSSGAPVGISTSTSNICQVSNNTSIEAINPGNCLLVLNAPSSGNFKSIQSQLTVVVTPAHQEQNISYAEPKNVHQGEANFHLDLVADSGLRLELTSDTPKVCTFDKPSDPLLVTIVGPGTCTMEVSQPGNARYFPFTASGVTFEVLPSGKVSASSGGAAAPAVITIKSSVSSGKTSSRVQSQTSTTSVVSTKTTSTAPTPSSSPNKSGVKISTGATSSKSKPKATPKVTPQVTPQVKKKGK